jgi:hypothetical protein
VDKRFGNVLDPPDDTDTGGLLKWLNVFAQEVFVYGYLRSGTGSLDSVGGNADEAKHINDDAEALDHALQERRKITTSEDEARTYVREKKLWREQQYSDEIKDQLRRMVRLAESEDFAALIKFFDTDDLQLSGHTPEQMVKAWTDEAASKEQTRIVQDLYLALRLTPRIDPSGDEARFEGASFSWGLVLRLQYRAGIWIVRDAGPAPATTQPNDRPVAGPPPAATQPGNHATN